MESLMKGNKEVTVRVRSWHHNTYLAACEDQTSVKHVSLAGNEISTMWIINGENPERLARFVSIYGKYLALSANSTGTIQSEDGRKDSDTWWRVEESSKGFPHVFIETRREDSGYYLFPGIVYKVKWQYDDRRINWIKRNINGWVVEIVGYRAISNQQLTSTKSNPNKEILSPEMRRTTRTNITVIGQEKFYSPGARWLPRNTINTGHNTNGCGIQTVGDAINGHSGIGDHK